MSTISVKRKPAKQLEKYIVGTTFEEVCIQEIAVHDRRVLEYHQRNGWTQKKCQTTQDPQVKGLTKLAPLTSRKPSQTVASRKRGKIFRGNKFSYLPGWGQGEATRPPVR